MWLFGALAGKSGHIIAFLLIALVLAVFLLPRIRQSVLKLRSQLIFQRRMLLHLEHRLRLPPLGPHNEMARLDRLHDPLGTLIGVQIAT